jgi:hypothetical protein
MLDAVTATLDPAAPSPSRSLADRDEYGPITGRRDGLFTARAVPFPIGERDELGRRRAAWVPDEHLL